MTHKMPYQTPERVFKPPCLPSRWPTLSACNPRRYSLATDLATTPF